VTHARLPQGTFADESYALQAERATNVAIGADSIRLTVAVGTTIADRPPQSGRTVARSGLRMMPTFPPSPLSFRTAGFPRYGWKAGMSDGAFPVHRWLKPAPGIRHLTPGLPPSFAHCGVRIGCPALCRAEGSLVCRRGVGLYSAPGALAPNRVILSRSIHACWPHPTRSQAHHDFADCATYTRCLRCAGAPRRPTSGSELSLHIPSWHAVPYVPGEIGIVLIQFFNSDIGLRRDLSGSALPFILPSVSSRARVSGLTGSRSLRPVRSLAPLTDLTGISPSHRGFYIQAFHGLVTLPAAGDNYDSYWTSSVGGTFTHWNGSYPRCTRSVRAR